MDNGAFAKLDRDLSYLLQQKHRVAGRRAGSIAGFVRPRDWDAAVRLVQIASSYASTNRTGVDVQQRCFELIGLACHVEGI